ncbi:MAG: hypothetical protein KUG79_07125 [Pseudomonadales bacterium]|nr:hypothetical protein [Pseudomonadales bacterium]
MFNRHKKPLSEKETLKCQLEEKIESLNRENCRLENEIKSETETKQLADENKNFFLASFKLWLNSQSIVNTVRENVAHSAEVTQTEKLNLSNSVNSIDQTVILIKDVIHEARHVNEVISNSSASVRDLSGLAHDIDEFIGQI